jgi:hypothetical protein
LKSTWEDYKGKRIFFARYDNLDADEVAPEIAAVEKEMFKQPLDSVLLLVETTGVAITPSALNQFKNVALHSQPYLHKTAILGMKGPRRAFMDIVTKFARLSAMAFDTAEQAREWLVTD